MKYSFYPERVVGNLGNLFLPRGFFDMTIYNYHPRCSIPYIDLNESPEREKENEENKVACKWQEGDGYVSPKSTVPVVDAFDGTIEHFENLRNERSNSRLEDRAPNGDKLNSLCLAAAMTNVKIIEHIVKFGKHLLEVGSGTKNDTPLLCAMKYGNEHPVFQNRVPLIADRLLYLGANASMANSWGETPLWNAVENTPHSELAKLLISHEAIIHPELSEKGKANLKLAINELFEQTEIRELYQGKYDENSIFRNLNLDEFNEIVRKVIATFKIKIQDQYLTEDDVNDFKFCSLL